MNLSTLRHPFRERSRTARPSPWAAGHARPCLEALEDRRVLSVLMVGLGPNAQYASINAAVAAAHSGDTIRVSPGTYHESVNVNKTLTFVAQSNKGNVIVDPGALGSGFNVQANDVTIRGFTIQDAQGNPGINLGRAFSGADIEHDVFRDNTFGVYLNSNGAHTTILRDNTFLHNNAAGAASGNGIYSDQGVSNAKIVDNFFTGQTNAAMIFVGNGSTAQAQFHLHPLERPDRRRPDHPDQYQGLGDPRQPELALVGVGHLLRRRGAERRGQPQPAARRCLHGHQPAHGPGQLPRHDARHQQPHPRQRDQRFR